MPLIIDISQQKISIGDKYTIAINSQPFYKAKASIWNLFPKVDVTSLQGDQVYMTIEQGWGFLKPNVTFTIGADQFKLETISWWKSRFAVTVRENRFEFVGHRGRKVSVLQNGNQIGWFEDAAVTFFKGDNYHCTANANAPAEWLIAAILFWDMHFNREQKKAVNIKFGNFLQTQPFDKTWQAN
jgi:hypothetical protein